VETVRLETPVTMAPIVIRDPNAIGHAQYMPVVPGVVHLPGKTTGMVANSAWEGAERTGCGVRKRCASPHVYQESPTMFLSPLLPIAIMNLQGEAQLPCMPSRTPSASTARFLQRSPTEYSWSTGTMRASSYCFLRPGRSLGHQPGTGVCEFWRPRTT
jgi:hypothetical protein